MANLITSFPSSQSLAHLVDLPENESIDLNRFIASLSPFVPESIQSLQDLVDKMHLTYSQVTPQQLELISRLVRNLIFRQFPHPEKDSVREVISNALDAHVRANREAEPIHITLKDDELVIDDQGDALGWSSLVNYFVPGRSSNAKAIFNLEDGIPKVTGRFGQGGLAIFYYLLYSIQLPHFVEKDKQTSLKIIYTEGVELYEATFSYLEGDQEVQVSKRALKKRKMSIQSRQGEESLKMIFSERAGGVQFDLQTPSKRQKQGSCFKIVSPLVERASASLKRSIQSVFRFVTPTPLFLNGERLNPDPSWYRFQFDEGFLYFSPRTLSTRTGTLTICEGGKLILEFPLKDSFVPEGIVLNFKKLPLTQERASLNFHDQQSRAFLEKVIRTIWEQPNIPPIVKSALLNGLYPLLKSERFDFIALVQKMVNEHIDLFIFSGKEGPPILPDFPTFHRTFAQRESMLLHPDYLTRLSLDSFHTKGLYRLYLIENSTSQPLFACLLENSWCLFVDRRLFHTSSPSHALFNFMLINRWLKLRDYPFQIDLRDLLKLDQADQAPSTSTCSSLLPRSVSALDVYESAEDANEEVHGYQDKELALFLLQLAFPNDQTLKSSMERILAEDSQYFSKSETWDKLLSEPPPRVLMFMKTLLTQAAGQTPKKAIRYLYDYLSQEEVLKIYDRKNAYFSCSYAMRDLSLSELAEMFTQTTAYLKAHPQETQHYFNFFSYVFDFGRDTIIHLPYQQLAQRYVELKDIIIFSQCTDPDWIGTFIHNHFNPLYPLEPYLELMKKVEHPQNRDPLFRFLHTLTDVPYLLTLSPSQLEDLVQSFQTSLVCIGLENHLQHKSWIRFLKLRPANYDDLIFLFQHLHHSQEIKGIWIAIYLELAYLQTKWVSKINQTSFSQFLVALAKEVTEKDQAEAYAKAVGSTVGKLFYEVRTPLSPEEYSQEWEKKGFLKDLARPFIYAVLFGDLAHFVTKDYAFPSALSPSLPLQRNPDVLDKFKEEGLAAAHIQKAIQQNSKKYFFVAEMIKNSQEAGATEVRFDMHLTQDQSLIIVIQDNQGMNKDELKALKVLGDTTKRKEGENPNYGWGFLSVFDFVNEVWVSTSPDAVHHSQLLFQKKAAGELHIQQPPVEQTPCVKGTRIVLKKQTANPFFELIMLRAHLVSTCQYKQAIAIFFQGQCINKDPQHNSLVSYAEPLIENGVMKGMIHAQIGLKEGGVFHKDIRMGAFPEEYEALIPKTLKSILAKDGGYFSVFFPQIAQVMNRSHLIDQGSLSLYVQRVLTVTGLRYCLHKILEDDPFSILSKDYWDKFDRLHDRPSGFLKQTLKAILEGNWDHLLPLPNEPQARILVKCEEFFRSLTNQSVQFPYQHSPLQLESFLTLLKQTRQEETLPSLLNQLKSLLEDERALVELLVHLPLQEGGPSLVEIRDRLRESLSQAQLLDWAGDYNQEWIVAQSEEGLRSCVEACIKEVLETLNESYETLLTHFKTAITHYALGIKSQSERTELPVTIKSQFDQLIVFLKKIMQVIWGKDYEVEIYSTNDNALAHVRKGINKVMVNERSSQFVAFFKLMEVLKAQPSLELNQEQIAVIVDWMETLSHEFVHLEENTGCKATHDDIFRHQLSERLETLLIREEDKRNVFDFL